MLKKIALVVIVALAALLVFAATRPDSFRVERAVTVKAPPDKLFALVNDFHGWDAWSPWDKLDPAMKRTFSGPASGKGAAYAWEGNSKVGRGRMEIVESVPSSKVAIKLDFIEPIEARNVAEFTFTPKGDATEVTWAMHGPSPYVSKLMGIFVSMDSMIGKDFEKGLAALKSAGEKP
jgi:uncharacterized protein YndB with AHSA1/START domain